MLDPPGPPVLVVVPAPPLPASPVPEDAPPAPPEPVSMEGVLLQARALPPKAQVPASLFDNVADNLIRNALAKRAVEPRTVVNVLLEGESGVGLDG